MSMSVISARMGRMVVHMVMTMMMGTIARRRHRHSAVERRPTHVVKACEEGASLHPEQSKSDQHDQGIADSLNRVDSSVDLTRGEIEHRCGDGDKCDRGNG